MFLGEETFKNREKIISIVIHIFMTNLSHLFLGPCPPLQESHTNYATLTLITETT